MSSKNGSNTGRHTGSNSRTTRIRIIGTLAVALIILSTAGMVTANESAAPFAFFESVKEFFGISAPAPQPQPQLNEAAAPLFAEIGQGALEGSADPSAMEPMAMVAASW